MRGLRWLAGFIGLGLFGLAVVYFRPADKDRPLNIGLDGCWEVEQAAHGRDVTCSLDPLLPMDQQSIRVLVRDATDAALSVSPQGCAATECRPASRAGESEAPGGAICLKLHLGSVAAAPGVAPKVVLELRAHSHRLGEQTIRFMARSRTVLDDLRQSWQEAAGKPLALRALSPRAEALVNAQPAGELRDQLQILAARIHYEELTAQGHESNAGPATAALQSQLLQALQLARQRRWLGSAATLSEELNWLYRQRADGMEKMEALLNGQPWLPLLPAQKIHCYRLLSDAALARQDLRRVERYQAEAHADAIALDDNAADAQAGEDTGLVRSQLELIVQNLHEQALSSSRQEVESGLDKLEKQATQTRPVCDRAYLLGSIAWIRLLLWELGWTNAKVPELALLEVIRLRQGQACPRNAQALANLWANLARLRSGAWWRHTELDRSQRQRIIADTRAARAQMADALGDQPMSVSLQVDQLLVDARLHLLNENPELALASLEQLLQLATSSRSPFERWLAMVHKGEAHEAADRPVAALQAFREAERELVALQDRVPIYKSHRLMLARYEYSSQRALALALRLGRAAEAMEIIRQASQRALGLDTTPWWSQLWAHTDPRWQQRDKKQAEYLERRRIYENQLKNAGTLNTAECQDLRMAKSNWLRALDDLFGSPSPALFAPPVLPAEELLIGCAPQGQQWVCLAGSRGTTQVVPIARRDLDHDAVEQVLLPALAGRIRQAAKIRVLAHGALAQLDLAAMRIFGRPLGTQKPIRYSVDLPQLPKTTLSAAALVVATPEDNIPELSPGIAQKLIAPALAGMQVTARTAEPTPQPAAGWRWDEAHSPEVLTDLERSGVFIFFGHVEPMPCQTETAICSRESVEGVLPDPRLTAMCLTQNTAIWAGDLLAARSVPQRVFLFGCSSADRSASTPTEMLGLAQSVALRGAQVLAFSRAVSAAEAAEVLCALGLHSLTEPGFDPDQFVTDTQQRLFRGERCTDRGKWYTPRCPADSRACRKDMDWAALRSYGS